MSKKRQNIRKSILALAFLLFEYRIFHLFFSPVLVLLAASKGIVNGTILIYGLLFIGSLFFGRAWCGWLCPGSAINHVCSLVVEKRPKRNKAYMIKYFLFGILAVTIVLLVIRAGGIHAIDPFFGMNRESTTQDIMLLFGGVVLIVPLAFILGKQSLCHYFCWQASLMIIGAKIKNFFRWPSLHLKSDPEACIDCGACDRNCPMSLNVSDMIKSATIDDNECILCGSCVDNCPKGAVQYAFGVPRKV